ncbi:MAG TPA: hypothetical protein VF857_11545 [Spirochaetota bacterium]
MKRKPVRSASIWCCVFFYFSISSFSFAESRSLEDYFSITNDRKGTVHLECNYTISDTSPDWAKILLAGLIYASSLSDDAVYLAVSIREQDGLIHTYTVRKTDLIDFVNGRTQLIEFIRKISMQKERK